MTRTALYPGSFDPITVGHVDLIRRALRLFDEVVVAVAHNPDKRGLFPVDERLELIRASVGDPPGLRVDAFEGLLVDYATREGIGVVVRGMRGMVDFEYEYQMANMNRSLAPMLDSVFLLSAPEHLYISSRLVKEVASFGGDITPFVPPIVRDRLLQRLGRTTTPGTLP
jgi:pantetheine-phosphate adenylyltransferase